MDDLIAFLKARLADDERPVVTDRMRREIAAKRAHIRMWEAVAVNFTHVDETVFEFAKREVLEEVLAHDAAVWSGHPGYRQEWKRSE